MEARKLEAKRTREGRAILRAPNETAWFDSVPQGRAVCTGSLDANPGGAMSTIATSHIRPDPQGVAWIDDTNVKVIEVVLDRLAYGWSPEEIHFQHPGLSLAQIHGALSYYYENQERLDTEIERRRREARTLASEQADSPLRQKLLALKKFR